MLAIAAILFAYLLCWAVVGAWNRVERKLTEKDVDDIRRRIDEDIRLIKKNGR